MTALGRLDHSNMLELLSNPTKSVYLLMELVSILDVGNAFVKATCNLEGNRSLVLSTYEHVAFLSSIATIVYCPNTAAIYYRIG